MKYKKYAVIITATMKVTLRYTGKLTEDKKSEMENTIMVIMKATDAFLEYK